MALSPQGIGCEARAEGNCKGATVVIGYDQGNEEGILKNNSKNSHYLKGRAAFAFICFNRRATLASFRLKIKSIKSLRQLAIVEENSST